MLDCPAINSWNCKYCALSRECKLPTELKYEPGKWFKAHTINEMTQFYVSRLPTIREAARKAGYAIGVHGSMKRDLDLMAMPWTSEASDKNALAHALAVAACGITREGDYVWESKPIGRQAVSICICWTDHSNPEFKGLLSVGHIDLSVIGGSNEQLYR